MTGLPGVSVAVATFNGGSTIGRCVESLATQSVRPTEIIVVNDGSTDGTLDVLGQLQKRFPGLITVVSQSNVGTAQALNRCISMCRGEYVAIADHDDFFPADRLERSVELIRRTGADMVGGQVVGRLGTSLRLAKSRFPTDPASIADRTLHGLDPLPHATMMITRDGFERFGGYRKNWRAADLELMLRWAHRGALIAVSPDVFATYTFRREFFSVAVQTRWMIWTRYARETAVLPDDEVPEFMRWFATVPLGPPRREARRRVFRLLVRLGLGSLSRTP